MAHVANNAAAPSLPVGPKKVLFAKSQMGCAPALADVGVGRYALRGGPMGLLEFCTQRARALNNWLAPVKFAWLGFDFNEFSGVNALENKTRPLRRQNGQAA